MLNKNESNQQRVKVEYFPDYAKASQLVICPWCFSPTQINDPDAAVCKICQREIREEDLIND